MHPASRSSTSEISSGRFTRLLDNGCREISQICGGCQQKVRKSDAFSSILVGPDSFLFYNFWRQFVLTFRLTSILERYSYSILFNQELKLSTKNGRQGRIAAIIPRIRWRLIWRLIWRSTRLIGPNVIGGELHGCRILLSHLLKTFALLFDSNLFYLTILFNCL